MGASFPRGARFPAGSPGLASALLSDVQQHTSLPKALYWWSWLEGP